MSAAGMPVPASSDASNAAMPVPIEVVPVSMTWISRPGSIPAAIVADWNVPDRPEPIVAQTTASAPSAKQASKASMNDPGDGAAVVGNAAPGSSRRRQNSSGDMSMPSRNS